MPAWYEEKLLKQNFFINILSKPAINDKSLGIFIVKTYYDEKHSSISHRSSYNFATELGINGRAMSIVRFIDH